MPTVTADALRRIGYEFFTAVGCRPDDAQIVADHLVQSNLYGHDSHGVVHMERYGRAVRKNIELTRERYRKSCVNIPVLRWWTRTMGSVRWARPSQPSS